MPTVAAEDTEEKVENEKEEEDGEEEQDAEEGEPGSNRQDLIAKIWLLGAAELELRDQEASVLTDFQERLKQLWLHVLDSQ